jgi:uncharacterized membrane protein
VDYRKLCIPKSLTDKLLSKIEFKEFKVIISSIFYRLAVALWVGGSAIFTFVLTPILFKSFDRDTAGKIVGFLFPAYFRWGLICGIVGLTSLIILQGRNFTSSLIVIAAMLVLTSFGAFYIEPKAAAIKKEIPSFETTSKEHPLRKEFSKLHGISAVCNLVVIVGGVALIVLM